MRSTLNTAVYYEQTSMNYKVLSTQLTKMNNVNWERTNTV